MAQNEVKIRVKIDDNGDLSIVAKKAKQAADSTDQLTNSRNRYQRGEKGVAGATSNSTKAFSKMQQAMGGGLVPAYATLAANVFALSAAFGVLRRAAQVEQLTQGLSTLGAASGLAMGTLSKGLQEATGHALSLEEAMRSTAMITSAGLDSSMIEQFGVAAKNASIALGRNTQDSLERFTRGVTKLEPELLDELGIFVKLDEAYDQYAKQLGKGVEQLTSFEKRQAFANATLDEATQKFGAISDVDANPFDKLAAAFADVSKAFLSIVNTGVIPFLTLLLENTGLLVGAVLLFGSTISGKLLGSLSEYAEGAADAAGFQRQLAASNIEGLNSMNRSSDSLTNLTAKLGDGTAATEDFDSAIRGQEMSMVSNAKLLKQGAEGEAEYARRKKVSGQIVTEVRKAQLASTLATTQDAQATMFAALASGNYKLAKEQLKVTVQGYSTAVGVARLQTTLLATAMGYARIAAMLAAGAFRLAGAAVSLLLGPVGIAISVMAMLYEGIKAVFNYFKSAETKALEEVVSDAAETAKELDKNFREINLALQGNSKIINSVTQRYKAFGNATSQVLQVLDKMEATQASGSAQEQVDFLNERIKGSKELQGLLAKEGVSKVNTANLETAKTVLQEIVTQGQQTASVEEALKNVNDETTKYFNTLSKTTPIDGMTDGLKSLMNALAGTDDIAEITKIIDEGIGSSGRLREMLDAAEGSTDKERLANLTETLAAEQERLRNAKNIIQSKTLEVKRLKAVNDLSEGGVRALIAAEQEVRDAKISQIDTQLTFLNQQKAAAKDADQRKEIEVEINRLTGERKVLVAEELSVAQQNFQVGIQRHKNLQELQKTQKMILSFAEKELSLLQAKQGLELASARRAIELKAATQQRSVSAAEEADLAATEAANLKATEEERIRLRTATINMEYALLESQFELEALKIATLKESSVITEAQFNKLMGAKGAEGKAGSGLLGAMQGLEGQRSAAIEVATGEERAKTADAALAATQAQTAAITEAQQAALSYVNQYTAQLRENGEYDRALSLEKVTNEAEIARLKDLQAKTDDPVARLEIQRQLNDLTQKNVALERERLGLNPNESAAIAEAEGRIAILREQGRIQDAIAAQRLLNEEAITRLETERESAVTTPERRLQIEKEIAALRQGNIGLTQENIGIAGQEAIRLGAPEGMTNAITGIAQDQADPAGVMNQGTTGEKFAFLKEQTEGFMSELAQLSPEGALMSSIAQGALQMGEAFSNAFDEISGKGLTMETAMQAVGATISAIGAMQQAKANQAVSAIDKEIAAEKKKDGKSKESIAKIKALEAKKEKIKRKAFEKDKKMKMAQVISSTALAVMKEAEKGFPAAIPGIAMMVAMGAAQLAAISSTSYAGGGSSVDAGSSAPAQITVGGDRRTTTDLAKSSGAQGELAYFRGSSGIGGPENFRPAAAGMRYRANGGNTAFMVGEQGPEMFVPERPGTIVPSDQISEMGTPINANINITALDADGVEDILMNQRGNIIGMLRDAANANGETFLESVSIQEY